MVRLRFSVIALAMVLSIAAVEPARRLVAYSDLEARAYSAGASGKRADAIALYTESIRNRPGYYVHYYRRGVSYLQSGRLQAALADLDEAVRLSPHTKTANELGMRAWNSLLPETYTLNMVVLVRDLRADILESLGRPKDAITDLTMAIALDLRRTRLWHRRGLLRLEAGDIEGATSDFDALLARRENVEWRFGRGLCHFAAGNFAEAESDFATASRLAPQEGLYAHWLKKAQKRRGIPV